MGTDIATDIGIDIGTDMGIDIGTDIDTFLTHETEQLDFREESSDGDDRISEILLFDYDFRHVRMSCFHILICTIQ